MPPYDLWLQTHDDIRAWCLGPGSGAAARASIPTHANGSPAFAQYKPGPEPGVLEPWSLQVLEISDGRISGITFFLDTARFFPLFGSRSGSRTEPPRADDRLQADEVQQLAKLDGAFRRLNSRTQPPRREHEGAPARPPCRRPGGDAREVAGDGRRRPLLRFSRTRSQSPAGPRARTMRRARGGRCAGRAASWILEIARDHPSFPGLDPSDRAGGANSSRPSRMTDESRGRPGSTHGLHIQETDVATDASTTALPIDRLREAVRGRVITPNDAEYDAARTIVLGGVDPRPAAIVRVADAADVARCWGSCVRPARTSPSAAAGTRAGTARWTAASSSTCVT